MNYARLAPTDAFTSMGVSFAACIARCSSTWSTPCSESLVPRTDREAESGVRDGVLGRDVDRLHPVDDEGGAGAGHRRSVPRPGRSCALFVVADLLNAPGTIPNAFRPAPERLQAPGHVTALLAVELERCWATRAEAFSPPPG